MPSKKTPRVARFYTLAPQYGTLHATRNDDKHRHATDPCGDYVLKDRPSPECLANLVPLHGSLAD